MKAITLKAPGGVENLILTDLPIPVIKDNEVLVQVKAISINPVDTYVRKDGSRFATVLLLQENEQPIILGWDISGVVVETGSAVTAFKKGDEVFGMVNFIGHGKAYAEYVAAPAAQLALKPAGISHTDAAAATLAALTAWQALTGYAGIKAGDKVLIHAAAGGVGHYAVQIAKQLGAYVTGTSSAANRDLVLSLGADEHIDYNHQRFEERVTDADIVLDCVRQPGHLSRSVDALKPGGSLVSLVMLFDKDLPLARKAKDKGVFTHRLEVLSNGDDMKTIAGWLQQGRLKSHVSQVFPFDEMAAAHRQIETSRTTGKIALTL